jgi:hypothetical protein
MKEERKEDATLVCIAACSCVPCTRTAPSTTPMRADSDALRASRAAPVLAAVWALSAFASATADAMEACNNCVVAVADVAIEALACARPSLTVCRSCETLAWSSSRAEASSARISVRRVSSSVNVAT